MSELEKKQCPTCGNPVASQAVGSLTQWIAACNCSLAESAEQEHLLTVTVSICVNCKRRIFRNNGSLTQWIFGENRCECQQPSVAKKSITAIVDSQFDLDHTKALNQVERELESIEEGFPIERFKPVAELGRGVCGVVYLCIDKLLNKRVAVKTLTRLDDDQLVAFQNEARTNSRLTHEYLLNILDFGATESGTPYMVMDYFPGISLEQYFNDFGQLAPEVAREVFLQLAAVLHCAHQNSIFHRDLKPSNILVSIKNDDVEIRLIDFGIARVKEQTGSITIFNDRALVGTPMYMAPDTAAGQPYDARSEIYSLGCILFQALTGETVFQGETALEILNQHVTVPPPNLRDYPELENDQHWSQLLARCLNKRPEERFQSMQELSSALEDLDSSNVSNSADVDQSSNGRRTVVLYIVGALAIFCACGAYLVMLQSSDTRDSRSEISSSIVELRRVARKGDVAAQVALGDHFSRGPVVSTPDYRRAFYWYEKAAKAGNRDAMLKSALFYKDGLGTSKNSARAFGLFRTLARSGDRRAQIELADCYRDAIGIAANEKLAFKWYTEAARGEQAEALDRLAVCYRDGIGVKKDRKKGFSLFLKAARVDYPEAVYHVADCYSRGKGVEKNLVTGFNWFKRAAQLGSTKAQIHVGRCYRLGVMVPENFKLAEYWFLKAASLGDPHGDRMLGYHYRGEDKSAASNRKSFEHFLKSAQAGDSLGMHDVGNCYARGRGTSVDLKQALYWYRKSAEAGSSWGQQKLASCYHYGRGVKKDLHKAIDWYRKSAAQKNKTAAGDLNKALAELTESSDSRSVSPRAETGE